MTGASETGATPTDGGQNLSDGRAAAVVPRAAVRRLSLRRDGPGLRRLAGHGAAIALAAGSVSAGRLLVADLGPVGWLVLAPALVGLGVLLVFLFAPLHECVHRTVFRHRGANAAVAAVAGFILFLPAGWFRAYHMAHHRYTRDPERDPECAAGPLAGRRDYLWRLSGGPYWIGQIGVLLRLAAGRADDAFLRPADRPAAVHEVRVMLALYTGVAGVSIAAGSTVLLWLWIGPMLLGMPALRAFLMAEHTLCPDRADMLANSRTTETSGIIDWLCWHMNRHTAHHAFPGVPFHALPALDAALGDRVLSRAPGGYSGVHRQVLASLRPPQ